MILKKAPVGAFRRTAAQSFQTIAGDDLIMTLGVPDKLQASPIDLASPSF